MSSLRWGGQGALFGALFVVVAMVVEGSQGSFEALAAATTTDPRLWVLLALPLLSGALGATFGNSHDKLRTFAQGLEQELDDRSEELTALDALQRDRLAGLDVGAVWFGEDGVLSDIRSAALERMLPGSGELTEARDLFARYVGTDPLTVDAVLDMLFSEHAPFEPTVALISGRFEHAGRTLEPVYQLLHDRHGHPTALLLQLQDRTDEVAAERRLARAHARIERLSAAVSAPEAFQRFRAEIDRLFAAARGEGAAAARALHTLKTNARTFGFHEVAEAVHQSEDQLERRGRPDLGWVRSRFDADLAEVCELLQLDARPTLVAVPRDALHVIASDADEPTSERLRALLLLPFEDAAAFHVRTVQHLAARRDVALSVVVEGPPVEEDAMARFDEVLGHLLTNAVTHAAAPDTPLTVRCALSRDDDQDVLIVQDDGQGVDVLRLAERGVASGHWSPEQAQAASHDERLALMFVSGVSSRDDVDEVAGRGFGMSAVQAAVGRHGGSIEVSSTRGIGTTFTVTLPTERTRQRVA